MTKVIIHRGYGLGWSTYLGSQNYEIRKFVLRYQPLIETIERIAEFNENVDNLVYDMKDLSESEALTRIDGIGYQETLNDQHPAVIQFKRDLKEKFDEECYFSNDCWSKLAVEELWDGAVKIKNYDGYESIESVSQDWA